MNEEGANTFNSMTENYIIETHTHKEKKKREIMNERKRGRRRLSIIPSLRKGRNIIRPKKIFGPRPHSIITLKWDWYFIKMKKKKKCWKVTIAFRNCHTKRAN